MNHCNTISLSGRKKRRDSNISTINQGSSLLPSHSGACLPFKTSFPVLLPV